LGSAEGALPTLDLGLPGWRLRPWRAADAPSLAAQANNLNVWRWMSEGFPHPYTLEVAEHWVQAGQIEFGGEHWAVCHQDLAVGGCGIHPGAAPSPASAEVGWWLGEPYWGRGVGTRVVGALVRQAFANPALTRLVAPIHAGNERSMRAAARNGFVLEGVQAQGAIKDGRAIDCWVWVRMRG
jgi:ribosomal-protein-alanine N-acetyltransferase